MLTDKVIPSEAIYNIRKHNAGLPLTSYKTFLFDNNKIYTKIIDFSLFSCVADFVTMYK